MLERSSTPSVTGLRRRGEPGPNTAVAALDPDLRQALRPLVRTRHLLVACDYDGTLAPIVANPNRARPLPGSVALLRAISELPATDVAVISGRALRDLAAMSRLPAEVRLVGSHGAEFDLEDCVELSATRGELLTRIRLACEAVISTAPGAQIEIKPAGLTVHVRQVEHEAGRQIMHRLASTVGTWDSVHTTRGKRIIEFSVVTADKGSALGRLRDECDATAVIFIGDDITDESAFARLEPQDVGVKVGQGRSLAGYRVADPDQVVALLEGIMADRRSWLAGTAAVPIEDHCLLSDGVDVALVTPTGSISWMCCPRPDGPAVFAGLLGDPEAGHLTIRPTRSGRPLGQRYLPGTLTVETKWAGTTVTDYLDNSSRNGGATPVRLVRHVRSSTPVSVTFAPRPQFGSVPVRLEASEHGVRVVGSSEMVVLVAPGLNWTISRAGPHETAAAVISPTDRFVIELRAGTEDMNPHDLPEADRRELTHELWHEFRSELETPEHLTDPEREAVVRSALTLKALCHSPTGAVLAAATTSLPEWLGGIRNWDYRYCWLRDAAMSVHALVRLGRLEEADGYLVWLEQVFAAAPARDHVRPLYSLDGSALGPEAVVDTLPGYAGSRPVRIGNAAQGQVQLDVYGPICALIADLAKRRGVTGLDIAIASACVDVVQSRWREPDHGIWEIRDEPRHHVHSRVMCWMAVDRALRVMQLARAERTDWVRLRDEIAAEIMDRGYDAELGTFVSAYGRRDVDAGVLSVVTSGLVSPDDPRATGTIRAVESALREGPTVYRYRHGDGLPGTEGGMTLCTSWLVEAYAAVGLVEDAEQLFAQMLACAGTTGLLPEMFDPSAERGLGNHPQAYSHLGVIQAALVLNAARAPDWSRGWLK